MKRSEAFRAANSRPYGSKRHSSCVGAIINRLNPRAAGSRPYGSKAEKERTYAQAKGK